MFIPSYIVMEKHISMKLFNFEVPSEIMLMILEPSKTGQTMISEAFSGNYRRGGWGGESGGGYGQLIRIATIGNLLWG